VRFRAPLHVSFHFQRKHKTNSDYSLGFLANDLSFYVLLINIWAGILIVSILLSLLAKCSFSFLQFFALSSSKVMKGAMALFTMSFSLAHIASSKTGLTIIDAYGYQANWFVMGSLDSLGGKLHLAAKLVQKKRLFP
jgi:hypothetical protein